MPAVFFCPASMAQGGLAAPVPVTLAEASGRMSFEELSELSRSDTSDILGIAKDDSVVLASSNSPSRLVFSAILER